MHNKINLLFLLLYSHRKRNLAILFIATLLIMLLSATLFISSSIQQELLSTLNKQADFTVQRFVAGKVRNTPKVWIEEFLKVDGVSSVQGRVYGMHSYEPKEHAFMVVGIDMYEEQIASNLKELVKDIDMDKFLSRNSMLIGAGVKEFFDTYAYYDYYIFRPPDRSRVKVYIYDTLPKESALMSNDMILMQESVAREILEVKEEYVTDIILNVANRDEMQKIEEKLIRSHFNIRIIKKSDIEKFYTNLFNYKGGVFLALFLLTLSAFLIILYQRYSVVTKMESKEIALLRMLGWRIKQIIYLKVAENFLLATLAYLLGVIAAYIYVFIFDAPLLKDIFLGYSNLETDVSFSFYPNVELLGLLFILFVVPFILTVIIPLYKIAITDISEVVK